MKVGDDVIWVEFPNETSKDNLGDPVLKEGAIRKITETSVVCVEYLHQAKGLTNIAFHRIWPFSRKEEIKGVVDFICNTNESLTRGYAKLKNNLKPVISLEPA